MNPSPRSPHISVRLIVPAILVVTASVTLWQDLVKPAPNSVLCSLGFCREDQSNPGLSYTHLDEANPYKWADYAESLDAKGDTDGAARAFQHALDLGPAIAPIHMRVFNFHLIHEHFDQELTLAYQILTLTPAYNQLIFSDLIGIPVEQIIQMGIPPDTMPAYLAWAVPRRPTPELLTIWDWMVKNRMTDAANVGALTSSLCRRQEYAAAVRIFTAWLGPNPAGYRNSNYLFNSRFESDPLKTPFDWQISPLKGVETNRKDGLNLVFDGTVNMRFSNVRQLTVTTPGTYVFNADVEAAEITTNEGVYFHVYDPDSRDTVDLFTDKIRGTLSRTTIEERFTVPRATSALVVQLERQPSDRVDSKIAGTFRIHEMSLRRVD